MRPSRSARVKRGIIPANGGTQRLPAQLPHAIAMEMLLIGDAIDAQTAARWGSSTAWCRRTEVMETALALARRIAANAPLAVQAIKELALRSQSDGLAAGLRFEQFVQKIAAVAPKTLPKVARLSPTKRPPRFKGN